MSLECGGNKCIWCKVRESGEHPYCNTCLELYRDAEGRQVTTGGRLPDEPTDALPGSEAKMDVMAERAERRRSLFHPDDDCSACGAPPLEDGRSQSRTPRTQIGYHWKRGRNGKPKPGDVECG